MAEITEQQKAHLKTLFERIDADNDGFITATDLKSLAQELGRDLTDERVKELISKGDPSGSGKVNFESFVNALLTVLPKLKAIVVAVALFRKIDKDGSGKLSKAELKNLIQEAGADVPDAKIDELIAKVDTTGTGQINFRDFAAALIEFVKSRA